MQTECEGVDSVKVVQDRVVLQTLVNAIAKIK